MCSDPRRERLSTTHRITWPVLLGPRTCLTLRGEDVIQWEIGYYPATTVCQTRVTSPGPDIVVGQQTARHMYSGDCARLTVLSCVYISTEPVNLTYFFSFYCIVRRLLKTLTMLHSLTESGYPTRGLSLDSLKELVTPRLYSH